MRRYERASTLLTSNRPVEVWANCWAMPPPSPPCSTASCTMATCSSVVHAVGEPKPTPPASRRILDEPPTKSQREAGQKPPGNFRLFDPGTSALELHPRISGKTKTLCSASRVMGLLAKGSAWPILRSQLRRLGPGSSHRARPRGEQLHVITLLPLPWMKIWACRYTAQWSKTTLSWVCSVGRFSGDPVWPVLR